MKPRHFPDLSPKKKPIEESDILVRPYSDEELEEASGMTDKIEKLMKFFEETGVPEIEDVKKAYPNFDHYQHIPGQHDTKKWLEAVKTIHYRERQGMNRKNAIRQVTNGWHMIETFDFLNWLKFHEEGAHLKYKFADVWWANPDTGYYLPVKPDPEKPKDYVSGRDVDMAKDSPPDEVTNAEKKRVIEKQRQKIIGRLDSAEKLLRSPEGQMFAGKELENLMESIFTLKKKVQLVNKLSTAVRLYEDMIIREANILTRKGFSKAADVLHALAEDMPAPASPAPPMQGSGDAGGIPSTGPGMPQTPPESAPNNPPTPAPKPAPEEQKIKSPGLLDFLKKTQTSNLTDIKNTDDDLEVMDAEDDLEVYDNGRELVTEGQAAPPLDVPLTTDPAPPPKPVPEPMPAPAKPAPKAPTDEEPLEVTEEDGKPSDTPVAAPGAGDFGQKIDQVFANVTVADVIAEFEFISNFYKAREIPRRLSRADMMLDSLGLASFFPSLAEAQNKALESNNYISSRVEEILSKLRGSIKSKDVELSAGETKEPTPEVAGIKQKLQSDEEKEKARKQMRKDQETAELENKNKETPEVEIGEDLGAPTTPPPAAAPAPKPV
jgi:hypothetical protein